MHSFMQCTQKVQFGKILSRWAGKDTVKGVVIVARVQWNMLQWIWGQSGVSRRWESEWFRGGKCRSQKWSIETSQPSQLLLTLTSQHCFSGTHFSITSSHPQLLITCTTTTWWCSPSLFQLFHSLDNLDEATFPLLHAFACTGFLSRL